MNESKDRRISERVPSRFRVDYVHNGDYLISHSRDLSVEGMFLHTENPAAVGEKTSLEFELENGIKVEIEAEVVWANANIASDDTGMAVKFIGSKDRITEEITTYVRKIALLNI